MSPFVPAVPARGAVLGLDTATPATAVAVLAGDGRRGAAWHEPGPGERPGHAIELLGLIEAVLMQARVGWPELTRVGVGLGPGSFTGLRIGVSSARALAQVRGLTIAGVGTLEVLAAAAFNAAAGPVLVLTEAGRRELFAGAWGPGPIPGGPSGAGARRPVTLLDPVALPVAGVVASLSDLPAGLRAVGQGAVQCRESLEAAGVAVPADASGLHRVDAEQLCRLTAAAAPVERDRLTPHYGREPDARPRGAGPPR